MPYLNELWGVMTESLKVTFLTLVRGMNPSCPILLLATSEAKYPQLDDQVKTLQKMIINEYGQNWRRTVDSVK